MLDLISVKIQFSKDNLYRTLPFYATEGSAGVDLMSNEDCDIKPGERKLINTGVSLEIPDGYELQLRTRSGLALKSGIIVLNAPGTIDSDYRGEIKIIIMNLGQTNFMILKRDRIAQGVFSRYSKVSFEVVEQLSDSKRASNGFGSTGTS